MPNGQQEVNDRAARGAAASQGKNRGALNNLIGMSDAYINFAREDLNGTVAVGSYLSDVFKRFGVAFDGDCDRADETHACEVALIVGAELLSDRTAVELKHFTDNGRTANKRLICESRIIKPGEIVIMTSEKQETAKSEETAKDRFQQDFEALPLEKKIASLLRMEAVTLGETFAYVVNSPMKVVEKVGDVIAEFGMKLETEARKASRPKEADSEPAATKTPADDQKARTPRQPSPPRPPKL